MLNHIVKEIKNLGKSVKVTLDAVSQNPIVLEYSNFELGKY